MRSWLVLALLVVAAALAWSRGGGTRARALERPIAPARAEPAPRGSGPLELEALVQAPQIESRHAAIVPASAPAADAAAPDAPPPNVLEVRVLAADGAPWADGRLRIRAASSPVLGEHRPLFPPADGAEGNAWMARMQVWEIPSDEGVFTAYRTDREGLARIVGVTPGLAFELLAVDALGGVGARSAEPPMQLGEERSVALQLARFPRELLGLCALPDGRVLADAEVTVREREETLRVQSDAGGRFATSPLFAERLLVQARHPGHGLATAGDVDPASGPVVLVLQPPRTLSVRLLGERGGSPSSQWMRLRLTPDGPDVAEHPAVRVGMHVFTDVPLGPLTLVLEHPAPRRVLAVEPGIESLTWIVPEQGEVELGLDALPEREDASYALEFRPLDAPEAPCDVWPLHSCAAQDVRQTLWTGTYEVRVLFVPRAAPDRPVPFGAPATVAIRGGETTRAELGR